MDNAGGSRTLLEEDWTVQKDLVSRGGGEGLGGERDSGSTDDAGTCVGVLWIGLCGHVSPVVGFIEGPEALTGGSL